MLKRDWLTGLAALLLWPMSSVALDDIMPAAATSRALITTSTSAVIAGSSTAGDAADEIGQAQESAAWLPLDPQRPMVVATTWADPRSRAVDQRLSKAALEDDVVTLLDAALMVFFILGLLAYPLARKHKALVHSCILSHYP
jgi:hypothetical protein